ADALAHELGGGVVGLLVHRTIAERRHDGGAAGRPARLVFAPPLVLGDLDGGFLVDVIEDAAAHLPRLAPTLDIFRLPRVLVFRGHRPVARRDAVVRRAL